LLSAGARTVRRLVAPCRFILPAGEFGSQDADILWGLDPDSNSVAVDPDHGNGDVADDDLLARLPAQNQHVSPP
jgi:hypothetical protein